MNQLIRWCPKKNVLLLLSVISLILIPATSFADKIPDEYVPPEVVVPSPGATNQITPPAGKSDSGKSTTNNASGQAAPGMTGEPSAPLSKSAPQTTEGGMAKSDNAAGQAPSSGIANAGGKSGLQLEDLTKPDPQAVIDTSKGTITIRLFRKLAPKTVANFVDLVQRHFYNGLTFHRVEPGFVIQGGCPNGDGSGDFIDPATHEARKIPLELNPKLRHNSAGVVAMARTSDPNSASCQFYITLAKQPFLDFKYAVFGGVLSGMDVVNQIQKGDKINSITIQEPQQ